MSNHNSTPYDENRVAYHRSQHLSPTLARLSVYPGSAHHQTSQEPPLNNTHSSASNMNGNRSPSLVLPPLNPDLAHSSTHTEPGYHYPPTLPSLSSILSSAPTETSSQQPPQPTQYTRTHPHAPTGTTRVSTYAASHYQQYKPRDERQQTRDSYHHQHRWPASNSDHPTTTHEHAGTVPTRSAPHAFAPPHQHTQVQLRLSTTTQASSQSHSDIQSTQCLGYRPAHTVIRGFLKPLDDAPHHRGTTAALGHTACVIIETRWSSVIERLSFARFKKPLLSPRDTSVRATGHKATSLR